MDLAGWRGRRLGPVEVLDAIDSTNAEALRRVDDARARDGLVLVVARQLAGHGSRGRPWRDVPGRSLALTAVLAWPDAVPLAVATWAGVVAISDLLAELGLAARIKWPNDALVGERKIAGVLAEARTRHEGRAGRDGEAWIALGIGLNVGHSAADFQGSFATPPTSLALEGVAADVPQAALRLLFLLDRRLAAIDEDRGEGVRAAFLERLGLLGLRVRASLPDRDVEGPLEALALDGTLTIGGERLAGGHVAALAARSALRASDAL